MKKIIRKELMEKMNVMQSHSITLLQAPYGFGKTTCMNTFLCENREPYIWLCLDNFLEETQFWNQLYEDLKTHQLNRDSNLSFTIPSNERDALVMLESIDKSLEADLFIVIDEFQFEFSYPLILLLKCCALHQLTHLKVVILSSELKNEKNKYFYDMDSLYKIEIKDLKISKKELSSLCKLERIHLSKEDLAVLHEYTEGWISLIQLCLQSYVVYQNFYNLSELDALMMKTFFSGLTQSAKEGLFAFSLLDSFSVEQGRFICRNNDAVLTMLTLKKNNFLVCKKNRDEYIFSSILHDYLKQKRFYCSFDEKAVYRLAAQWYVARKQPLKAISMFLKCGKFEEIIELLMRYNESFMDKDPNLIVDVFSSMPRDLKYRYPYVYLEYICDNMTNIDVYRGNMLLENFKEDLEKGLYQGEYQQLLGEYYFINAFSKFNDAYAMMEDFHNAYNAFQGGSSKFAYTSMVATFGSFHLLYLYHIKRGELKQLVEMIVSEVGYFTHISHGVNAGADFQVRAEFAFETGAYEKVWNLAESAFNEALFKKQYSICGCSLFLRARHALLCQDNIVLDNLIEAMKEIMYKCDNPIVYKEIEGALSYLYILMEDEEQCAEWIRVETYEDEKLLYETAMLSYLLKAMYQLKKGHYESALIFCEMLTKTYEKQEHIFGSIYNEIFQAIAYDNLGEFDKADEALGNAILLAKEDNLITIFIEFSQPLKRVIERIKDPFVEVLNEFLYKVHSDDETTKKVNSLSKREREIAFLLVENKTVKKIAEENAISINTVQAHTKQIYKKLNINSKFELMKILQ